MISGRKFFLRNLRTIGLVLSVAPVLAAAEYYPGVATDQELRSAYCIPILDRFAASYAESIQGGANRVLPPDELTEHLAQLRSLKTRVETARNRLWQYLLARGFLVTGRDPISIAVAKNQGMSDFAQCEAEQRASLRRDPECKFRCMAARGCPLQSITDAGNIDCFIACAGTCGEPTCLRINACRNPTWLPY